MKLVKFIPTKPNNFLELTVNQAKKQIPERYKNSSQKIKGYENYFLIPENPMATTSTYKKCSPFLDALSNGYIFYLSQDIEVIKQQDGSPFIAWRTDLDPVTWHSNNQWEGLHKPDNCYNFLYKWENYFGIKTPKKYSTLITHPHNRFDLPFYTLSGIVDTDKFNLPIQFPFFLKENFVGIIKAGTPLAQISFFKRTSWLKNTVKYNEQKFEKEKFIFHTKIDRSYKNLFWEKKNYN